MVWQIEGKQNLLNRDFKKVFLVNDHDNTFWVATRKNIITNLTYRTKYMRPKTYSNIAITATKQCSKSLSCCHYFKPWNMHLWQEEQKPKNKNLK